MQSVEGAAVYLSPGSCGRHQQPLPCSFRPSSVTAPRAGGLSWWIGSLWRRLAATFATLVPHLQPQNRGARTSLGLHRPPAPHLLVRILPHPYSAHGRAQGLPHSIAGSPFFTSVPSYLGLTFGVLVMSTSSSTHPRTPIHLPCASTGSLSLAPPGLLSAVWKSACFSLTAGPACRVADAVPASNVLTSGGRVVICVSLEGLTRTKFFATVPCSSFRL
jgi:hypothetical protein